MAGLERSRCGETICDHIVKKGYSVTAEQVAGRWKSLTRAYKNIKDNNSRSGATLKEYEYEEELDEIFAKDPAVFPKYTLSSSPQHDSQKAESPFSTLKETEESTDESTAPPKKKKKTSHQSEIVNIFKEFVEEQKKDKQRREALDREKIEVMANLVDVLKSTAGPSKQCRKTKLYVCSTYISNAKTHGLNSVLTFFNVKNLLERYFKILY